MFRRFCAHLRQQLDALVHNTSSANEPPAQASVAAPTYTQLESSPQKIKNPPISYAKEPAATQIVAEPAHRRGPTVDPTFLYRPTRWLLLACFEASEAAYAEQLIRSLGSRERVAVGLFGRLTGNAALQPPWRHAAEDSHALFLEAVLIHRRAGELFPLLPTARTEPREQERLLKSLRRWLFGKPDALPRLVATFGGYEEQRAPPPHGPRQRPARTVHAFGSSDFRGRAPPSVSEAGGLPFYRGHPEARFSTKTPPVLPRS